MEMTRDAGAALVAGLDTSKGLTRPLSSDISSDIRSEKARLLECNRYVRVRLEKTPLT